MWIYPISRLVNVKFVVIIGYGRKMSHKNIQNRTSTFVFQLICLDLMGSMQVESLEEKRYVFVYVNDYFSYTWVEFVCEKSDNFVIFEALFHHLKREKEG